MKNILLKFRERIANISSRQAVFIIVLVSATAKLAFIKLFGGGLAAFPSEGSDITFYNAAAMMLWKMGNFGLAPDEPNVGMPPGQPTFLALLYAVSNGSIVFAKLGHVALLTAVAVLTYFTGKEFMGTVAAFGAGILIALDPAQAYLAGTFLSDSLFIFFMVLGLYFLVRHRSRPTLSWLVSAGVCVALAGLTRNQGWLFAVALWLGALITWGRLISIRAATIVLLVTCATIAPWTLRNYKLSGQFIPVSLNGGLNLWSGNNPEFVWRQPMPMSQPLYARPPALSEQEADQYYGKRAMEWIVSHPINFMINGIRKVIVLYSFDPMSLRPKVAELYRLAGIFPYGILMPFIAIGLVANIRNAKFGIVLWYILFTTVMAFIFYGDSRIRAPIQPYLYLLGMSGLGICIVALDKWRESRALILKTIGDKAA